MLTLIMNEERKKPGKKQSKHISLGLITSWVLGVSFLMAGLFSIGTLEIRAVAGAYIIASCFLLPPIRGIFFKMTNMTLSTGVRVLVVFVVIFVPSYGKFINTGADPNADARVIPGIAPLGSAKLKLLSFNCSKEHGFVFIRGEVQNISGKKLENVVAVGTFRDAKGTLIKTETALLEYNPIMPDQTSPFEAGGTDNPLIDRCAPSFKYLMGGMVSHTSN